MTRYTTVRQYNMIEDMCFKFAFPCIFMIWFAFRIHDNYIELIIVRSLHMTEVSALSALICSDIILGNSGIW